MSMMTSSQQQFIEPARPDPQLIDVLHRGNDGHITFTDRNALGQFQSLFSVRAKRMLEVFPEFIERHIDADAFYTINSMWMSPRELATPSRHEPKLSMPKRSNKRLRWLTAAYVDLDCHKLGIKVGTIIGACINMQDSGIIPPASVFVRSGRGVWLFWLLHDDEAPDAPVRAWEETISTYRRIENKLVSMFNLLGADPQAKDPSRVTRVPGSLNRKSGTRVGYWVQLDEATRKPYAYRLDELAVRLGVRPTKYTPELRQTLDPKNPMYAERGKKGFRALHRSRLSKLMLLIGQRLTIQEGCRNHCALILTATLRGTGIDREKIDELVYRFGRTQCTPPMNDNEIATAIESGMKPGWKFTDYTIADWLRITPEESESPGIDWPAAGTRPLSEDTELRTSAERRTVRREIILQYIENPARVSREFPTVRELQALIERETGSTVSLHTIKGDLVKLGIKNPRAKQRSAELFTATDSGPQHWTHPPAAVRHRAAGTV
jgi:hypothetical protein